jgi:nucleotide-binding universal stress UspA family protein
MSVRKFLLPLGSPASAQGALHLGLMLAKVWSAHLDVLHIKTDTREIAPFAGEGLSGALIEGMITASAREEAAREAALRELFAQEVALAGVAVGEAQPGGAEASASFTSLSGPEEQIVAHRARLADLTIVPHPLAGDDIATAEALHAVLFDSGRPVMLAPVAPPAHVGTRIAVAWTGSARSASALASAMPFIRQAQAVRVLVSPDYVKPGPGGEEVAAYIAHHGVTADVVSFGPLNRVVGAGLLAAAADFGADLLVMGPYSTASRLRQLILGGTTRHVLESAPLPVLMNT